MLLYFYQSGFLYTCANIYKEVNWTNFYFYNTHQSFPNYLLPYTLLCSTIYSYFRFLLKTTRITRNKLSFGKQNFETERICIKIMNELSDLTKQKLENPFAITFQDRTECDPKFERVKYIPSHKFSLHRLRHITFSVSL